LRLREAVKVPWLKAGAFAVSRAGLRLLNFAKQMKITAERAEDAEDAKHKGCPSFLHERLCVLRDLCGESLLMRTSIILRGAVTAAHISRANDCAAGV